MSLSKQQLDDFEKSGYLIFDRFLNDHDTDSLKKGVDTLIDRQKTGDFKGWLKQQFVFEVPALGDIVVHDGIMNVMRDLLGDGFYFHHIHAAKHVAGTGPANWHQDYEQKPQLNRTHRMCHAFIYLNGLNGEVGDLMVVPGTQNAVVDRNSLSMFGTDDLPGSVVIDKLSPGSIVVVHSALWHARRAKPGGENSPRYFIDTSYCQAGVRWPGYPNFDIMCRRAHEIGLVGADRNGHLFQAENYFSVTDADTVLQAATGSLVLQTREWAE